MGLDGASLLGVEVPLSAAQDEVTGPESDYCAHGAAVSAVRNTAGSSTSARAARVAGRGVLVDVEHNMFWSDGGGPRPPSTADAVARARDRLSAVPQLVPVYSHRYLPSGRESVGHPVLSVYQTDVIYYGLDLLDYVHQEFGTGQGIDPNDPRGRPRSTVAFWRDLIE